MKLIRICLQIGILFLFSYAGNLLQATFHLILPGSIIGLLLLFVCLCLKVIPAKLIEDGAGFLIGILTLLFIPMTVGIMKYPSLLSIHGLLLFLAVLVSTVLTIAVTGAVSQRIEKRRDRKEAEKACSK